MKKPSLYAKEGFIITTVATVIGLIVIGMFVWQLIVNFAGK